jgi:hypothetical protein
MHCPDCSSRVSEKDEYCPRCGAELSAPTEGKRSTSIIPAQTNLPALLYRSPLPRNVAAGVGALAVGVGIELLRRNLLGRLQKRAVTGVLPALLDMKELLQQDSTARTHKLPKGYEVHESIYMVRRVIRRG